MLCSIQYTYGWIWMDKAFHISVSVVQHKRTVLKANQCACTVAAVSLTRLRITGYHMHFGSLFLFPQLVCFLFHLQLQDPGFDGRQLLIDTGMEPDMLLLLYRLY